MRKKILMFVLPFLLFLIPGLLTVSHYSINWDEPVHFGRGEAILYYFLTGKKDYSSFSPNSRRSYYQNQSYTYSFFEKSFEKGKSASSIIGGGHPPLSDIFASVFNTIFYQWLGILGDIESYHLYSIFLAALLAAVIFYFVAARYNVFSGTVAFISLSLYPLFLGESRYNIKDTPETVFFSFSILCFYRGVISNSIKWIFFSALFFAFAFATKLNVIFLPFIILPWMAAYYLSKIKKIKLGRFLKERLKIILSLLFYPILGLLMYFLSWPILWQHPIERFITTINYYKEIGINTNFDSRFLTFFHFNTYASQWILYTTPIIILILSILGIVYIFTQGRREKDKASILILLWLIVPILRVTMPNAGIYGGVRQIMEYIPAMAMLSGIGAGYIVKLLYCYIVKLNNRWSTEKTKFILKALIIVSFIPITLKLISIHPNESVYFNQIIGGLKGAKERNIPGWGSSLGSTYKQGTTWINQHAEKNAKVVLVFELLSNIPKIYLRPDITLYNQFRSGIKRAGEYAIGITHEATQENLYYRRYLENFLNPVYELKVDGVAILKIWKNDAAHTKPEYLKPEEKVIDFSSESGNGELTVDLKQITRVTKIEIKYNLESR